jgi:phosphoribosylanthranilate isomerase
MTKIKICGLRREADIDYANLLLPDYIGFIFAEKSPRYIAPDRALKLGSMLNKGILPVGVFQDEPIENAARLLNTGAIELAQLHGDEDEDYIRSLKSSTAKPIIKAFRISSIEDIACAQSSSADFILLDGGSGGTGQSFDWSLLKDIDRPYFLAGGLTAHNAAQAVRLFRPYAVDVSSGVETDRLKDFLKMSGFVRAVKEAQI